MKKIIKIKTNKKKKMKTIINQQYDNKLQVI
jgi:hypothetical protein